MASQPIQLINQRTVQPSSQAPGFQQVQYSPEGFGSGIGRALLQTSETLGEAARTEAALRNEVKANDALTQRNLANDELRTVMFDPSDGVLAQNGGRAMGVTGIASAHTEAIKKKYLANIQDPETKSAFEKVWSRDAEQAKDQAARHELSQLGTYKVQTAKTVLGGAITDAYNSYNDKKAIDKAIDDSRMAIRANSLGLDPASIALAEEEAESSIHLAALSRWAAEDPHKALSYYEANKDNLSGKDHVTANGFVQTALQERKARENVALITGVGQAGNQLYSAVEFAESGGEGGKTSSAGALGIMQVMPDTAREVALRIGRPDIAELGDAQLTQRLLQDDELNRTLGRTYLNEQLKTYGGDIEVALVAYNAGPGGANDFLRHNVGRAPGQRDYNVPGRSKIKSETESYVQKVMGRMGVGAPQEGRLTRENWTLRNFQPDDLMAPTEGGQWVDARAAGQLDTLADRMQAQFPGFKIKINEDHNFQPGTGTAGKRRGTSDPKDNPHVQNSQHVHGTAFDIQIQGWNDVQKAAFVSQARQLGFGGIGFYGPDGHLHIDMGTPRKWGKVPAWARDAMNVPVGQVPGTPAGSPTVASFGGTGGTGTVPGQTGGYYTKPEKPDLGTWLEAANAILDPGERERTIAGIRIAAAQQDDAIARQEAALKNEAWQTVVGGSTQDLQPQLLAQLEPSFVNSLYSYEANRASGTMPMDWQAWAAIPTDPAVLAKIDPNEYRNKLDDSHYDQFLTMHRAAQNSLRGDAASTKLLANVRSTKDIIGDTAKSMGWDPKSTAGATHISNLNRAADERILAEQAAKGSELNAVEIQDIVDKLLITDKSTWFTEVPGFETEDPSSFVAAEDWESVQEDDKTLVVNEYERLYGQQPDKETATRLYNEAMRVYLGADPVVPEEALPSLDAALSARYGITPTDQDRLDAYRTYLLGFLGR